MTTEENCLPWWIYQEAGLGFLHSTDLEKVASARYFAAYGIPGQKGVGLYLLDFDILQMYAVLRLEFMLLRMGNGD